MGDHARDARRERDIGIALGLPEPYATELQAYRERLGDPESRLIAPHITLVAPVRLTPAKLALVEDHLREVAARHAPFTVRLAGTGTFRPVTEVVYVAVVEGGEECAKLAADVRDQVTVRPSDYPYHPHVTVAHNLPEPALQAAEEALAGYRASFQAWGVTLYERGEDQRWRPQRDYQFAGVEVGPALPR